MLFTTKLGHPNAVKGEAASCSTHICPKNESKGNHHPHSPHVCPSDVEQALFIVTDVSFAVHPHFPSISNGRVSICTLEDASQGKSDRHAQI